MNDNKVIDALVADGYKTRVFLFDGGQTLTIEDTDGTTIRVSTQWGDSLLEAVIDAMAVRKVFIPITLIEAYHAITGGVAQEA